MLRHLLAPALLALAPVTAHAEYVFDSADLPEHFACDEEQSAEECEQERKHVAWWQWYGDRYDRWFHELLFNTDIYFADYHPPEAPSASPDEGEYWDAVDELGYETPNLADALYMVSLRRFGGGWAFAVDMVCPKDQSGNSGQCTPRLRMVSFHRRDEIPYEAMKQVEGHLPTSRAEVAAELRVTAKWEEADLRTCRGALNQLLALSAQKGRPIWHPRYVRWLRGEAPKLPGEIIVLTDGSGVFVRTRSAEDPEGNELRMGGANIVYSQWNGGDGMRWALDMAETVRPCLKPASAPAPWDKIMAAEDAGKPAP